MHVIPPLRCNRNLTLIRTHNHHTDCVMLDDSVHVIEFSIFPKLHTLAI